MAASRSGDSPIVRSRPWGLIFRPGDRCVGDLSALCARSLRATVLTDGKAQSENQGHLSRLSAQSQESLRAASADAVRARLHWRRDG
jgi:hypothetical protein